MSEPGTALIREGIQNALDARVSQKKKVTVRIYLSGEEEALHYNDLEPFVSGLLQHLKAPGNGLENHPTDLETCPFLVFEDFETTGLTGDPGEGSFSKAQGNHFFHFLRAEGRSDKGEESIGRWGVGKSVFNLASRASAFLCLTVRKDDGSQLLMGHAILKHHSMEGKDFVPDGYLGVFPDEPGCFAYPIEDNDYIKSFTEAFQLLRDPTMAGLSVIVPWYNLTDVNNISIIKSTLKNYFWAILQKRLEVWVEIPPKIQMILDAESISSELENLEPEYKSEILPIVKLTEWAIDHAEQKRIILKRYSARRKPNWLPELFPDNSLEKLRGELLAGEPIALRVPVLVKLIESNKKLESFFDVYLERDESNQYGQVSYIRDGMVIPEVDHRKLRHYRCLVVVEDKPLATMLGDAENPAHTEWRKQTRGFKGKYTHAVGMLDFVINGPSEIVKLLLAEDEEVDRRILSHFFSKSIAHEEEEAEGEVPKPTDATGGSSQGGLAGGIESTPEGLRLRRVSGGFSITGSMGFNWHKQRIRIETAYFTRRGNPFKAYNIADFNFAGSSIELSVKNAEIVDANENRIEIEPTEQDFRIEARGFDQNRDLKVRATLEERKYARKKIEFHGAQAN